MLFDCVLNPSNTVSHLWALKENLFAFFPHLQAWLPSCSTVCVRTPTLVCAAGLAQELGVGAPLEKMYTSHSSTPPPHPRHGHRHTVSKPQHFSLCPEHNKGIRTHLLSFCSWLFKAQSLAGQLDHTRLTCPLQPGPNPATVQFC